MIVLIDNYDSFTYNLYQYLMEYTEVVVFKNDEFKLEDIEGLGVGGIVISPGPKSPVDIPAVKEMILYFKEKLPILGVCLGHQAIYEVFGGKVVLAPQIVHGKTSNIKISKSKLFKGLKEEIKVMRYHSLIGDKETLPNELEIIGETVNDSLVMAVKHKVYEIYGVQFHPESILTEDGKRIIENFVEVICNENK